MKGIPSYLSTVEANVQKMDKQETQYTGNIEKAKQDFDELRAQSVDLDQDELNEARLALRPQMEHEARERVRKATHNGRASIWNFQLSVNESDKLLGEENMTVQHRRQRSKGNDQQRKGKPYEEGR